MDYVYRVQPGKCYHLLTKHQLGLLADYQLPEMLRTPLEELVLQIKILKMGTAAAFLDKAIEPPSETAVLNALSSLRQLVKLHLMDLLISTSIFKYGSMYICSIVGNTLTSWYSMHGSLYVCSIYPIIPTDMWKY